MSKAFYLADPTLVDYWRALILLGQNTASYKFALAKTLLNLKPEAGQLLLPDDLTPAFAAELSQHIKEMPKQSTRAHLPLVAAAQAFHQGDTTQGQWEDAVRRTGFTYVLDAFHRLGPDDIAKPFYVRAGKGILITDAFAELQQQQAFNGLMNEAESRWRLVEQAWALKLSRSHIYIGYDDADQSLFVQQPLRRRMVTSSRSALNGYQKGHCFYCHGDIDISGQGLLPDVDHFMPHQLKTIWGHDRYRLDGIWNLVLSCPSCNRGEGGKFGRLPAPSLLARLHQRNEFLISSHHPLRETLIQQTGPTVSARQRFIQDVYTEAGKSLPMTPWLPKSI